MYYDHEPLPLYRIAKGEVIPLYEYGWKYHTFIKGISTCSTKDDYGIRSMRILSVIAQDEYCKLIISDEGCLTSIDTSLKDRTRRYRYCPTIEMISKGIDYNDEWDEFDDEWE